MRFKFVECVVELRRVGVHDLVEAARVLVWAWRVDIIRVVSHLALTILMSLHLTLRSTRP